MSPYFRLYGAVLRLFKDYTSKLMYCHKLEYKSENKINYPKFYLILFYIILYEKALKCFPLALNSVTQWF